MGRGIMAPNIQLIGIAFLAIGILSGKCYGNLPPVFTQDMNNLALSEATPVGQIVYRLEGYDPEGGDVTFGLVGSDNFMVDSSTGDVTVVKPLDREVEDTLSFLVTIKDRVNPDGDSENDNLVKVPITVIVLDENDNPPDFQNVPYETEISEDATLGATVFDKIFVTDRDNVGENLNLQCISQPQSPDACQKFIIKLVESEQKQLRAAIVLNDTLDYNERMIYFINLSTSDGMHISNASLEIRVKDIQNSPPVFQGSLAAIIDEDSPIGTLVMTVVARDGDRGQPRKIIYDLISNPMDYFLLDSKNGELRTAKPLDKESLPDATGLITLTVRARELIDGVPGNDPLTMATSQASVTIRDVNDSPPTFNQKEYYVSLSENTAPGTPLPLEITVQDPDVGQNAVFELKLDDVSGVFDVEPKQVIGSSQVSIRVANGTLDYENPNQRKFIVLIIAEETETSEKLSSTATLTVSITDANDNRPIFDEESYSVSISELASAGQLVTTITARDIDSGNYGDQGIRYELTGAGSELFNVDPATGTITVAPCPSSELTTLSYKRKRRQILYSDGLLDEPPNEDELRKVNVTLVSQTGLLSPENLDESMVTYEVENNEYPTVNPLDSMDQGISYNGPDTLYHQHGGPGKAPCLDYETQQAYFFSYKATDDNGNGQSSIVSLRIKVDDANDSPPECENKLYRAALDEGASHFDPPLIIKAKDADTMADINYRIIGSEGVSHILDIDKRTGQLSIHPNATIDVTHLKSEQIFFSVEANDGIYSTLCNVNISIRDVNNHAPQFVREHFVVTIPENTPIGSIIEEVSATDLDSGINADIRYRIQQGSFDDFQIDSNDGVVTLARKLDYDNRNFYTIELVASDLGTPSLSGTATLSVSILNSNDKNPYFTPATQRVEVAEDVSIGTIIHSLVAHDPDVESNDVLEFTMSDPITAVDKDGKEIVGTDEFRNIFLIDRYGNVTVNQKLNRDLFAVIRIPIVVTDPTAPVLQQGKGLLVIGIIDINEIPPMFVSPWSPENPEYNLQLSEELPIGTILTTLQATDDDSTIAEYNLMDNDYFEIENLTGIIRTKSRIDYEAVREIHLNASVLDSGVPQLTSTAKIIINVININDNEPIFNTTEYKMNVLENSGKGTVIGKVEATDNDLGQFGEITYSLVGDLSRYFNIDPENGIITVNNVSFFDHEQRTEARLTVIATDKAPIATRHTTAVPVVVKILDVNDNSPIFTEKIYYAKVAENAALNPPAAILRVNAFDADDNAFGDVKYYITGGNEDNIFRLDPDSGILYPAKSLKGLIEKFVLEIQALDGLGSGPHSDQAQIIIEIHSINNHQPVFIMPALSNATIELQENLVMAEYLVMRVKAYDNDTGENGRITYHLQVGHDYVQSDEHFIINENSGELRTKQVLNRKQKSKYELILVARDQGTPKRSESIRFLTILLVDVSENKPEFPDASNPYKFYVYENSYRDIRVGKIQAKLKNNEPDSSIYYYMLLGNENGAFYLDKTNGDLYTNKSLDREEIDSYHLYILASKKSDLHISDTERATYSIKSLERDSTVAKVQMQILDVNDNPPVFEKDIYYAGVNSKANINDLITIINATDKDFGVNGTFDLILVNSNLYKFGAEKSTGSIVPSPFAISKDGRLTTATYIAEYSQDRFELEIIAREVEPPERTAKTKVYLWIFNPEQLIRVILSRPPSEVNQERDEIIEELRNATQKRIIVDEIRYHVDPMGRIRMDWCDLFFHAVDPVSQMIVSVDDILKNIDAQYDFLKDYYAGFAIENVVPAYSTYVEDEFDLALAALIALLIVLFVGIISFAVICCCLKNWTVTTIPTEIRRKDALIKKQIIDDLTTTENPLWIEQKLKLYEEQELTMQVFSEPEVHQTSSSTDLIPSTLDRRDSYTTSHGGDNTYATIQPRSHHQQNDIADYATLRNTSRNPSMYEFTGTTFQAPLREHGDFVTELI